MSYSVCVNCKAMVPAYEKYCARCLKQHPKLRQIDDYWKHRKVYEIARSLKEAESLRDDGFGYDTLKDAQRSLNNPEIDSYYRNLLKVYELDKP